MMIRPNKNIILMISAVAVFTGAHFADAQFVSPACVPPNCNPQVIQNIALNESAQTADFNITGDGGVGSELEVGRFAPVLTQSFENLIYGNVGGGSSAGALLLLQKGGVDVLRVGLNGTVTTSGIVNATGGFSGNGSAITNINATNITSGTVNVSNLPANVLYTTSVINASQISTGIISTGQLPAALAYTNVTNDFTPDQRFSANVGIRTAPSASYALNVSGTVFANRYNVDLSNAYFDSNRLRMSSATGAFVENVSTSNGSILTVSTGNSAGDTNDIILSPGGVEAFRVYEVGGAQVTGSLNVTGTVSAGNFAVGGSPVCLLNGTNCPISSYNIFSTMNVPSGTDPVADSDTDTLNWTAGTGVSISGVASTDTITIANTGVTSAVAGAGIGLSGGTGAVTITNTGDPNPSDDITGLNAGVGISVSGSAPTLTVTNTGDTNAADDITGSGTVNYIPKFSGTQALSNSNIYDNGSSIGIGNTAPAYTLDVSGDARTTGDIYVNGGDLVFAGSANQTSGSASWIRDEGYLEMSPRTSIWGLVLRQSDSNNYTNLETNAGYSTLGYGTSDGPLYLTANNVGIATSNPLSTAALHIYGNGHTYGTYTSYPTYGHYAYTSSYSFMGYSNGTPIYGYSYGGSGTEAGYFYNNCTTRVSYDSTIDWGIYSNCGAYFASDVGIGTASPVRMLHVKASYSVDTTGVVRVDRGTVDGDMIEFVEDGVEEGRIRISGGTVSYQGFTGSHMANPDRNLEAGRLVSLTGTYRRNSDKPGSEPIYDVVETTMANDPAVMGALLHNESFNDDTPDGYAPADVMAVGNGDIWVVDGGEDLMPGDYLISSNVAGHAMKDPGTYEVSNIIARVGEPVNWSEVDEWQDSKKHKRITVFFEVFERVNVHGVQLQIDGLNAHVVEKDTEQDKRIEELEARLKSLEKLLK